MSEENTITPAVNLQEEEMPNEMSATEFQQKLYTWFEDRGLLAELRAYLRKQMIGVLKDTALGRTVSAQKQSISPKLQALNLLVAEFLLQQDYHYSLSVFSTEVPLINVLPEFPGLAGNYPVKKNQCIKKWRFSQKDMWDILETLGMQRDSEESQNIFNMYYSDVSSESLLTCVIRMLHSMQSKFRNNILCESLKDGKNLKNALSSANKPPVLNTNNTNNNRESKWVQTIREMLISNKVNNTEEILIILKEIIEAETKRLKDKTRVEYQVLEFNLQRYIAKKEGELKKKLERIETEKAKIQNEKVNRESETEEIASKVQRHEKMLKDRWEKVLIHEKNIHDKETQLQNKEEYLVIQEQNLQERYTALNREQQTVSDLQQQLECELKNKQKLARNDADFLKDLQQECQSMRTQITTTQKALIDASNKSAVDNEEEEQLKLDDEQGLIRHLQTENNDLKMLNSEQKSRIDQLSQRASLLIRELNNSQSVFQDNQREFATRYNNLSAPSLIPPITTLRSSTNPFSGAGEDGFHPTRSSPTQYRNLSNRRDAKQHNTPPRRLIIHSSSSSDDRSPTTEILQEAREKLRRLEQETEEVDRQFKQLRSTQTQLENCYQRHLHNDGLGPFASTWDNNRYSNYFELQDEAQGFEYFTEPQLFFNDNYEEVLNNSSPPFRQNHSENTSTILEDPIKLSFPHVINITCNNANPKENKLNEEKHEALNEKDELKQCDNHSFTSSGILEDLLAAGTSGASFSGVETPTDEQSDLQLDNENCI